MPTPSQLAAQIEAVLFWKGGPLRLKDLASHLGIAADIVLTGIRELESSLKGRGITLVKNGDEIMLGTSAEHSSLIERLTKEDLVRDLGKAGLETLSIVLYQGPISRADIDYIRGVNSQFILRNLLIRGLVERIDNPGDARSFLYKTTLELLAHMGISKVEDIPEYEQVRTDIALYQKQHAHTPAKTD